MKKLFFLLILSLGLIPFTKAQEFSRQFGEIGDSEINLKKYSRDPLAEAVVLFDIGDARFIDSNGGYDIQFTHSKRIKILSKDGIQHAGISIPFYKDNTGKKEEINSLIAVSYNLENGRIVGTNLDPSTVYEETINNQWSAKKFVFPNVKEGTIIEYKYILTTPFLFNLPDWKFQSSIPTVYSRYTVRMTPFYEYSFLLQGINKFDYQTSTIDGEKRKFGSVSELYGQKVGDGVIFNDMIHVYGMNNVPAFRDESYITSVEDNLIKIDFQLARINSPYNGITDIMTTWPKIIKDLLQNEYFGKFLNSCGKQASKIIVSDIPLAGKSDDEKCRAIVRYVKTAYKWDEFHSIYSTKNARDFLNQKNGNSAEINLFLTSLLNEAGLKAYPVIISTRDHGRISQKYPFLHFFNSIIVMVYINDKPVLCDATEYFTQYNRIPPECINELGLIIMNGAENWVKLNLGYGSFDEKTVIIEVNPENLKSKIKVNLNATEYDAYYYRKTYQNDTVKLKEFFTQSGINQVNKISTLNFENSERPFSIICDGEGEIEQLGDNLIISPFHRFYPSKNRLTEADRTYPIDFTYANTEAIKCSIKVPEGYKIATLPEGFSLENELVKINLAYASSDGIISMDCSYGFKKAVYLPADYRNIKSYFDIIVRKFNEKIVLVKT